MAGRIPQDFIDDLIERVDIAEVIGSRVQLKKAGREYKAPCPFHSEKTPSFTVSSQKGFYHCFGCGAHGTAISFLMEFDRLEFPDAVEELAQIAGVPVPRDDNVEKRTPLAPVHEVLHKAAGFYRQALKENPTATDYLKSRGLDGETVRAFGIGFAPASWDFLLRRFGDGNEMHRLLKSAGLIVQRDNGGYYDRFRDRVMFPIRDSRGRVIGFGGRVIGDGEPKYLNSPETPAFHKGRELYGLYEARQAHRKLDRVLVVEGYMDVVSLACQGIQNAVGTLGTATTPEHLRRLFRASAEIVFCFDGDRAGRAAAWRALQTSLPEMRDGRQVGFMFLPDGEDPDSLVRHEGKEGLSRRLQTTVTLSDYLLQELETQTDMDSMDGRARLAELARPLLEQLPDGIFRAMMADRLAGKVGIDRDKLTAVLSDRRPENGRQRRRSATQRQIAGRPTLARRAIQLILNYPAIGSVVTPPPNLAAARHRGIPLLLELLEITRGRPDITSAGVLERFRDRSEGPHLEGLLAEEVLIEEASASAELSDSLQRIADGVEQQRLEELIEKAESSELNAAEKDELRKLRPYGANRD
ncbi:MAG: DNA primase [Gammaproteobacteria bacterium]|nr:DNA primase [Gammaproteobacteria bacterium]